MLFTKLNVTLGCMFRILNMLRAPPDGT